MRGCCEITSAVGVRIPILILTLHSHGESCGGEKLARPSIGEVRYGMSLEDGSQPIRARSRQHMSYRWHREGLVGVLHRFAIQPETMMRREIVSGVWIRSGRGQANCR